ncbi:MAG: type II secretion system protein [Phycisphaerales bacterium]|nr:type II secretion system protein [Phycisphaerales bacterium]
MRTARGITFLEVVFASAMLAVVAATVASGFSMIDRLSRIGERKLAAYEVAHRLILQFLDSPTEMPDDTLPLPGEVTGRIEKFWYLLNDSELVDESGGEAGVTTRGQTNTRQLSVQERIQARLSMVTVEVYEDDNGRRSAAPLASITRLYDPFAGSDEDPATFMKHLKKKFEGQPEVQALLESLMAQMLAEQQAKQSQNAPPPLQPVPGAAPAPPK